MGLISRRPQLVLTLLAVPLFGLAITNAWAATASKRPDFSSRSLSYEQDAQDQLSALARLTKHYYAGVPIENFADDAWAMAQGFASLGLNQSAEDHYRRAASLRDNPEQQNQAWLALARSMYRRGAFAEALDVLNRLSPPVSEKQRDEQEFLRAQSRMALGNYAEAALGLEEWKSPNRRDNYTRYNLGVSLIKVGDLKQGTGLLEQVGTTQGKTGQKNDAEQLALRDQANVVLGFSFLRAEQGATAKPVFQRVRLDGPLSDKALLGAGWAELAPQGQPQEHISYLPIGCIDDPLLAFGSNNEVAGGVMRRPARDPCDRDAVFKTRKAFAKSVKRESREIRLKRALVPWMELMNRDARRAPVQEAMVAAPYVMVELGAFDQATETYRFGIQRLEHERRQLEVMLGSLKTATMAHENLSSNEVALADISLESLLRRWQLDDKDARLYLKESITSNAYRQEISRYNRLLMLRRKLQQLKDDVEAETQRAAVTTADVRRIDRAEQLADRREVMLIRVGRGLDSQGEKLKQTLVDQITQRRDQIDNYLAHARFSLARLFDAPPESTAIRLEDIPPEPEEPGFFTLRRWIDNDQDTSEQGNALTQEPPSGKTFADKEERSIFDVRGWFKRKDEREFPLDSNSESNQTPTEPSSWNDDN